MLTFAKKTFYAAISHFPRLHRDFLSWRILGRGINWRHPRDLNEWISYLLLYSDTTEWSRLADKYAVRQYVGEECGFPELLVPLLGVWDDAAAIDFSQLPREFVLKCNHGSGDTQIIRNNTPEHRAEMEQARAVVARNLKMRFGKESGESHYFRIPPRAIAEQLLDVTRQSIPSSSLVDYKCWYIHGELQACMVIYDRANGIIKTDLYDPQWNNIRQDLVSSTHEVVGTQDIPCPQTWEQMKRVGARLAKGFPQVRVDFYEVDGKLYFGELTFTSCGGLMPYFSRGFLRRLGDKLAAGMPPK
jgi:hypothetical protein